MAAGYHRYPGSPVRATSMVLMSSKLSYRASLVYPAVIARCGTLQAAAKDPMTLSITAVPVPETATVIGGTLVRVNSNT